MWSKKEFIIYFKKKAADRRILHGSRLQTSTDKFYSIINYFLDLLLENYLFANKLKRQALHIEGNYKFQETKVQTKCELVYYSARPASFFYFLLFN